MELVDGSVTRFTELLASKAPVPGGGGASALVGAVGIALGDMVGELTVGKKKYAAVEEDIRALMDRAQDLRRRLLDCVEKDAVAFEPLSRAYAIPKEDPDRDTIMEKCLRDATGAPLEIFDLVCEAIEIQRDFAEKGSKLAVSDAATGVSFCRAALEGAAVNVRVNTRLMKDRAYAEGIDRHIEAGLATYRALADQVFESVYGQFC